MKQEKMWDFTVRGWRVANVTGMEDSFKDKAKAVEPQKKVNDLKYDDTKIGKLLYICIIIGSFKEMWLSLSINSILFVCLLPDKKRTLIRFYRHPQLQPVLG